ncbi:MAG: hypothetical protein JO322_08405 [Candidatus Eremiobacteraeota bacterium]|nr:hypothetical protein [Candidatus Eremiobacteraeota bacterium]
MKTFESVAEALDAGYEVLGVYPDDAGFLHARTKADANHYALALIRVHHAKISSKAR